MSDSAARFAEKMYIVAKQRIAAVYEKERGHAPDDTMLELYLKCEGATDFTPQHFDEWAAEMKKLDGITKYK